MGNAPSQQDGVADAVASSLSPRGQQRLSQAPTYMNFFEAAAVAPVAPPSRPKKRPPATLSDNSSTKSKSSADSILSPRPSHDKRPSASTSTSSSTANGYQTKTVHNLPLNARASSISESPTVIQPPNRKYQRNNNLADKVAKLDYVTVDGRRYLTSPEARFFSPVDEDESDRLVIMHFLLKYAFGCSFKAPVGDRLQGRDRCQVLDIGCGPGTWVLEMASDFPNADIYGVDLVRMYPSAIKPGNAKFSQHDILHSLPFADESLDYVHMRMMLCNLTQAQVIRLLSEINRVLKPGGYIELLDVEYRVQRAGPLNEELLNRKLYETMRSHDVDFHLCYHLSTILMMQGGGFIDVRQDRVTIPLGWGGQLGQIHAQNMETYFNSLHPAVRNACATPEFPGGLTVEAVREIALEWQQYQSHYSWYACYGQKAATSIPTAVCSPSSPLPAPPAIAPPVTPPGNYANASPTHRFDKHPVTITPAAARSAIVEETWESINDFIDGYID